MRRDLPRRAATRRSAAPAQTIQRRRTSREGGTLRPRRDHGLDAVLHAGVLKIPLAAACWLVWYAIKAEPEPDEEPSGGEDRGPRRKLPPRPPRWPRRGPAGGGAGCKRRLSAGSSATLAHRLRDRAAQLVGSRQSRDARACLPTANCRLPTAYCSTARSSRCIPTLRFTRCRALSTVFVSQPRRSATSS